MKYFLPFCICFSIFLLSCNAETNKSSEKEPTATAAPAQSNPYPAPPQDLLDNLFQNCGYIDYVFSDLPVSISQDQKGSIQAMINYFTTTAPASINTGCKPLGRSFYQINGDIVLEADFYFDQNCTYYIFFQDNKPMYSSVMSEGGINFFNKMMAEVKNQGLR